MSSRKRLSTGKYDQLISELYNWIVLLRNQQKNIPGFVIQEKASVIAEELGITDFNCSKGWFVNFKNRFCLKNFKLHGEAGSADVAAVHEWIQLFSNVLDKYENKDIINVDETLLFYEQFN